MHLSPLLAGLALAAALLPLRALEAQRPTPDQPIRPSPTDAVPPRPAADTPTERPAAPPAERLRGHLVLVVEGTVRALRVRHALAKPDPWGGVPKGLRSPFALAVLDADRRELLRVPVDLSRFDTDPARADGPVRVEGCEVKSPQICVLVNLPRLRGAATYRLVRTDPRTGDAQLGVIDAATLQRLLESPAGGGDR